MAEIYGDLPSPIVHSDSKLVCSVLAGDDVGMRSTLYSYQRRSVAAMIEKEIARNDIPSPLYITITGINGRDFYLQPATMEVLQERPMVQHNRGGVLCEELGKILLRQYPLSMCVYLLSGTGKTVMILALILATLDQLPSPEESFLDTRPVMTPLALRTFPSSEFETARKRAVRRPSKKFPLQGNKVPSLVELLIHHIRISTEPLGTRHYEDRLESMNLLQPVQANTPFYHHYEIEVNEMERSRRKQPHPGPRTVYLTSASLIVVPPNLIAQWDSEIMKHCCSGLRYLVLKSETKMPSTKALVSDYDVSSTHSRNIHKLIFLNRSCSSRIPVCSRSALMLYTDSYFQDSPRRPQNVILPSFIHSEYANAPLSAECASRTAAVTAHPTYRHSSRFDGNA